MLAWPGSKWETSTNAIPLSAGIVLKKSSNASSPPAEAPIPTMGKTPLLRMPLREETGFFETGFFPGGRVVFVRFILVHLKYIVKIYPVLKFPGDNSAGWQLHIRQCIRHYRGGHLLVAADTRVSGDPVFISRECWYVMKGGTQP